MLQPLVLFFDKDGKAVRSVKGATSAEVRYFDEKGSILRIEYYMVASKDATKVVSV